MKKSILKMRRTLRFRRWSRKAYSILISLKNHVTVGQVCKSIAEASCKKSSRNAIAPECCRPESNCYSSLSSDDRPEEFDVTYNTYIFNVLSSTIGETSSAYNCPATKTLYLKYQLATDGYINCHPSVASSFIH